MSHKPQDLKTYFLGEPLCLVRAKANTLNTPNIHLINPPNDQLKKIQDQYGDQLDIVKGFECFGTYVDGIFFKTVFVSPLLAETIRLAENEHGNDYQLVEVEPGNLCDPDLDDDNHISITAPEDVKIALYFGLSARAGKPLLTEGGHISLAGYVPFSLSEKADYINSAKLPQSYLDKLLKVPIYQQTMPGWFKEQALSYDKLADQAKQELAGIKKDHGIIRHCKDLDGAMFY